MLKLTARSLSQSLSLSQELSSARSRKTSGSSHGTSSSVSYSPSHNRPNLSISMSSINVNANERSVQSLEKEIMRLQEVLKERETEITSLETTLKEQEGRGRSGNRTPSSASPGTPINGDPALHLSPKTMSQFQALRRSLDLSLYQSGNGAVPENDESLDRLNELMRCVGPQLALSSKRV